VVNSGNVLINGRQCCVKNKGRIFYLRARGAPEFIEISRGQINATKIVVKPSWKLNTGIN